MARKYSILGIPRFVYPLILNTWAVLSFWLFQTKPLWTFMYKYSIHMCFHFSCVNTVEWNGRIVSMVGFSLKELPDCFPKRLWPLHSSGFPLCYAQLLSLVQVFVISWIEACQAPLSLEFSRQEYWSGLPFSLPGVEPVSVSFISCLVGRFFTTKPPRKPWSLDSHCLSSGWAWKCLCCG